MRLLSLSHTFDLIIVILVLTILWSLYHGLGLKFHLCAICGRPVRVRQAKIHLRRLDHRDVDTAQDVQYDYLHQGQCDDAYCEANHLRGYNAVDFNCYGRRRQRRV